MDTIDVLRDLYSEPLYDHLAEIKFGDKVFNLEYIAGNVVIDGNEIKIPFKIFTGISSLIKTFDEDKYTLTQMEIVFVNYNRNILTITSSTSFSRMDFLSNGVGTLVFKAQGNICFDIQSDVEEVSYFK